MYVCVMFSAAAHAQCEFDSKFSQTSWSVGSTYYTDRAYTITGVSSTNIENCLHFIIKTPNDDRNNTQSSSYMKFEMPFDGYVDIAFDSRLTSLPTWASGYTKWNGNTISTSLSTQPYMQLWYKLFTAGDCVELGANKAAGASTGAASNYVVFLESENCDYVPPPPSCNIDSNVVPGFANNGSIYYTDRAYTLTDVGPFAGMFMLKTPNDDRNNTMASGYFAFTSYGNGYIYVAYDRRATTPPNWLTSNFTKLDCTISTSLASQGWLDVYQRQITTGECVNLGGNKGPGFSGGTVSNYIIMDSKINVSDCVECPGDQYNNVSWSPTQTMEAFTSHHGYLCHDEDENWYRILVRRHGVIDVSFFFPEGAMDYKIELYQDFPGFPLKLVSTSFLNNGIEIIDYYNDEPQIENSGLPYLVRVYSPTNSFSSTRYYEMWLKWPGWNGLQCGVCHPGVHGGATDTATVP